MLCFQVSCSYFFGSYVYLLYLFAWVLSFVSFVALVHSLRIYAITFETIAIAIEKDYFDIKMTGEISDFVKAILFYKAITNCFLGKQLPILRKLSICQIVHLSRCINTGWNSLYRWAMQSCLFSVMEAGFILCLILTRRHSICEVFLSVLTNLMCYGDNTE